MDKNLNDLIESVNFIKENMVTKSDLRDELKPIRQTLGEHTTKLNIIEEDVKTIRDKRLQLEVRTTAIESHLGIKPPAGTIS